MFANQPPQPLNILLAVDGSEHSLAAARFVHDLPLPVGSQVSILSVLIPREAGLKTYPLQHFIERITQMLRDKGVEIKADLLAGNPSMEIIRAGQEICADLIVIGAKGLRATLGILLGGVAQQVVEYSSCPVVVVRAPYMGVRNILMVVDGSEQSEGAVDYLVKFPFCQEARVQLMHVLPPIPSKDLFLQTFAGVTEAVYYPLPDDDEMFTKMIEEEAEKGEALLQKMQKRFELAGIGTETVLQRGDAATEILTYAKENHSDLVVAGSRGLGGFEGWLLGSVSRKLVHYAECSVLIFKRGCK